MPTKLIARSPLRLLRPRKLDFYILGEVLMPFVGAVVFLCFVFLMFQALRLAEFFIIHGVSGAVLGEISGLMMLSFLPYVLPVGFLIAVLSSFGRLSSDSELVAMKANGISIWRMAVPVVIAGLGVGALSLALNMDWVPWGEHRYRELIVRVSNTKATSSIKEGTFTTGFFDLLIYTDRLERGTNKMHRVFIYDEREPRNPVTVVAQEGAIVPVKTPGDLSAAIALKLFNGNIHRSSIRENTYSKIDFDEYRLYLSIAEGGGGISFRPRIVPQAELVRRMHTEDPKSQQSREFRTELWRRYATSLSPLIFVFFGIGFGTVRTRAVRMSAALVGLIVVLIYWGLQGAMIGLGYSGVLHPAAAMMIPNLVILALAVPAFRSAMW